MMFVKQLNTREGIYLAADVSKHQLTSKSKKIDKKHNSAQETYGTHAHTTV